MDKKEVIKRIALKRNMRHNDVQKVIESFFIVIKEGLQQSKVIHFRNFGKFMIKKKKEKIGRDFSQQKSIVIEEQHVPFFKPSKSLLTK